ncbi:MAG TPA: 4-phosphoerythronate dehydrogenase, partial [archaeon]|nr:4-phosphoerythronate dehydrogenase [archaeon]
MNILADENMPLAREAFSNLGEVRLLPGREISPESVADCDILAVRSVTLVDQHLLEGSRVRFVGTATIGTDHVDTGYLSGAGVGFASAPGCNAVSVAEYVTAALFVLAAGGGFELREKSLGIIGVGNVGSRVSARAEALGMRVVWNDPPLYDQTGDPRYRSLDEALEADIITFHAPLEKAGPYPTYHMADAGLIKRLRPGAILLNTSRGGVMDSTALEEGLASGRVEACVLDVWENEPDISLSLLSAAAIGTPHIAGYSLDGKVRGTQMIYEAACRYFGLDPVWDPSGLLPEPERARIRLEGSLPDAQELAAEAVVAAYPILADDSKLREIINIPEEKRGAYFDSLRKNYPVRREFSSRTVELAQGLSPLAPVLKELGFKVEM